jgi:phage shock protein PspC (stress-responsive transcriptional regulator)
MFCSDCGFPLEEGDLYCGKCGRKTVEAITAGLSRPLRRPVEGKKVAGVCAGFAHYFDMDVTVVRLLWVGASVVPFVPGLFAYPVCWALMPRADKGNEKASKSAPAVSKKKNPIAFRQGA